MPPGFAVSGPVPSSNPANPEERRCDTTGESPKAALPSADRVSVPPVVTDRLLPSNPRSAVSAQGRKPPLLPDPHPASASRSFGHGHPATRSAGERRQTAG